jgi:hypothetical protein
VTVEKLISNQQAAGSVPEEAAVLTGLGCCRILFEHLPQHCASVNGASTLLGMSQVPDAVDE